MQIHENPVFKFVECAADHADFINRFKLPSQIHKEASVAGIRPCDDGTWSISFEIVAENGPDQGSEGPGDFRLDYHECDGFSALITETVTVPEYDKNDRVTGRHVRMVDINLYAIDPDSGVEMHVARLRREIVLA